MVTIVIGWIYAQFNAASDPASCLSVGFVLIVAIYVQTAILFGVYTPELFPTEIRLRANGICNTLGRGATVVSPFIVGSLMANYKLPGVIGLMIGLLLVQIVVVWAWGIEPARRRWKRSRSPRLRSEHSARLRSITPPECAAHCPNGRARHAGTHVGDEACRARARRGREEAFCVAERSGGRASRPEHDTCCAAVMTAARDRTGSFDTSR